MSAPRDLSAIRAAVGGRERSIVWGFGAGGAVLLAAGLCGGDGLLARGNLLAPGADQALSRAVGLLDWVSGKEVTNFLLGAVLVLAGLFAVLVLRRARWAPGLLYVGMVQLLVTVIADLAKPPFGRLRPFQAVAGGHWTDGWFTSGGSFPSGHAAFYAGLFVPLALLFPRWAAALLALPLLVGAERVLSHDHYPSDVGASFLLAGILSAVLWRLQAARLSSNPISRESMT